jgi:hypothetical protein
MRDAPLRMMLILRWWKGVVVFETWTQKETWSRESPHGHKKETSLVDGFYNFQTMWLSYKDDVSLASLLAGDK